MLLPVFDGRFYFLDFPKCTNGECGWHGDADENASHVLSIIGGVVSLLRGSDELSCAINPGLLKYHCSVAKANERSVL